MKTRPLLQNLGALSLGCLLLVALSGPFLADSDDSQGPESSNPLLRPISRDFGAGDNLTLGYRGTRRLTETEIEFEAVEPG